MNKYKITNVGKRPITFDGQNLSQGQSMISNKRCDWYKTTCETVEYKNKPELKVKKTIIEEEE